MSNILPINIDELLHCRGVESARVEFKGSWDEKTTGYQILKTICAFANDLQNLNGGYIVVGAKEDNGCAILPPAGLAPASIDAIQKWIRGHCNMISPEYQPIFSPEVVDSKHILVIWAQASDIRPHKAPDGEKGNHKFYVRIGSESVDAEKNGLLQQLLQQTSRVPFDDRRSLLASIDVIRERKVREFLNDIRSGLVDESDTKELYRKLRVAQQINGHDAPKNVGLMLFSNDADEWFNGARIEVVHFADDASGNVIEEKIFRGGVHEQLTSVLSYLESISSAYIEKQPNRFKVKGWVSYPISALREAIVNAVYHRSYDGNPEPTKVYLYPNRIEIISYPGPIQGIKIEHLMQRLPMPPVPARNRRIGEFLKELKLAEGRGTGLPKLYKAMRDNGSKDPLFDFDDDRTYFRVTLPSHPEYVAISALRDAAYLRALGRESDALQRIEETWAQMPDSPSLAAELIRFYGIKGQVGRIMSTFEAFQKVSADVYVPYVTNVVIEVMLDLDRQDEAKRYLESLPQYLTSSDAIDAAILARRMGRQDIAHRYFERAGETVLHDARALHEFAQTKIKLAQKAYYDSKTDVNRRLLNEAKELLIRVTQLDADGVRHAWAWRDIGKVNLWTNCPKSDVVSAYRKAIELDPNEQRFREELDQLTG